MISQEKKQIVKFTVAVTILVLLLIFVVLVMIKYEVEGEENMPYELSKIVVIGTVEGVETQTDKKEEWNFSIYQNNDVYFYIDKNTNNNKKNELIKSVKISNIQIIKTPLKGKIKTYMPNSKEGRLYTYDNQFLVIDKLEYHGSSQSSSTNLEIGSQGGTALIRFSNADIGEYTSNDSQIIHNSTLLRKVKVTNEEIKFSISCDFMIETTENKYQANISLDMPTGNLGEEKKCYLEKTDMSDVIFKRIK